MNQVDYTNPVNYKPCVKKQYEIHVCKPPMNTIVINKLEQADVVKQLGGKTYFTIEECNRIAKQNPQKLNTLKMLVSQGRAYLVNQNTPFVLAGTLGEMWTIDAMKLSQRYVFLGGGGSTVPISPQTLSERGKNGILNWTVVRTIPNNSKSWACFVPSHQKGQVQTSWGAVLNINGVGVSHGKGDFVIASDANGKPDLSNAYVVNGNIFATTYNNKGWTDYIDKRYTSNNN